MAERSSKKRKIASSSTGDTKITDPRFANIQSDPRYRLPSKKHKVKLDSRFSRALQDDNEFTRKAKVDRYGRPLDTKSERTRLKRKYEFEEDEEEQSQDDDPDDDDEVQKELERLGGNESTSVKKRDILREGRETDSSESSIDSSSDEDDDDDVDEEAELAPQTRNDVPVGEVSARLAVVNLDWDNIRAEDLMAVFSSFLGKSGKLLNVTIYPSEFGKERMQREEMEGPPKEIFAAAPNNRAADSDSEHDQQDDSDADEEEIKRKLLKPDSGEQDFDSQALRQYQLDRLRYYYAILTFSSPSTAKHIYDAVDGTEYLSTANFFDLRFVPDSTDFSSDIPREECSQVSSTYKPNEFVTDALQHSKVKLTWDAEDTTRKEAAARAFRTHDIKDLEDVDLAAYIGSDSSDSDSEDGDNGQASKKDTERQRMRSLLGLAVDPPPSTTTKSKSKTKTPVGNVEITFSAGLTPSDDPNAVTKHNKRSVFANSPEPENETTIEKYVRKEKERKAKRREKAKAAREGGPPTNNNEADDDDNASYASYTVAQPSRFIKPHNQDDDNDEEDLGFNDPFFTSITTTTTNNNRDTSDAHHTKRTKSTKADRLARRQARDREEAASAAERKKLEALMTAPPTSTNKHGGDAEVRHFDMKEITKAEKAAAKAATGVKDKKSKKKKKKGRYGVGVDDNPLAQGGAEGGGGGGGGKESGFKIDAADKRFEGRLFGSHEFAIDPSNPRFGGTEGMRRLVEEGRRRRKKGADDGDGDGGQGAGRPEGKAAVRGGEEDVKSLVAKIRGRKERL